MNPQILFLSVYFLITGGLEFFLPERANICYEKWIRFNNFRLFSFWAFAIGVIAYLGMPVQHLKWFVLFLVWMYGVMGFWILISPYSFISLCQKGYFSLEDKAKIAMIRFDGFTRFVIAALLFYAAKQ